MRFFGNRLITRLPATCNEHERLILGAIAADDWQEVGRIAQTPPAKNRPGACYRVQEGSVTLAKPLTDTQKAFLQILQVPASCFTQHPRDG